MRLNNRLKTVHYKWLKHNPEKNCWERHVKELPEKKMVLNLHDISKVWVMSNLLFLFSKKGFLTSIFGGGEMIYKT